MTAITTAKDPLRPVRSKAEARQARHETTNQRAREIIDAEARQRERKTERLRRERLKMEQNNAPQAGKPHRAEKAAKPRRTRSSAK